MAMPRLAKIGILKKIDSLLGPIFVSAAQGLFPPRHPNGINLNRILILRPGGIGDGVLLVPVLLELKKKCPDAEIDILAEKRNASIFSLCSSINAVYRYDKHKELRRIFLNKYDMVIDTEQWHRMSAVVARLTRAPILIGYATNGRKKLFTHPISYSHDDYEVNSFLNLLAPLDSFITVDLNRPFLSIPQALTDKVKSLLQPLSKGRIVALFPGGSIKERRWGSDQFHEVTKMLLHRGCRVLIIGGKEDLQNSNVIAAGLLGVVNLCGRLSLPETASALHQASLLITGDSGIMHVGYGLGIKIVALFGPGIEKKWAPKGDNIRVINKRLPCSPCTKFGYTPKCKKNAECMKQITVEEVYHAAIELLER